MKLMGRTVTLKQGAGLCFYYLFCRHLPHSRVPLLGRPARYLRNLCGRMIFRKCNRSANIERGAFFYSGVEIKIGERSGIGVNCSVPDNIVIGDHVMMGPGCCFLPRNHRFDRTDIPMCDQGYSDEIPVTVIEDDVWIGRSAIVNCGRRIRTGSILGAGCVLTKDFPSGSIVGGNPARLIRNRLERSGE